MKEITISARVEEFEKAEQFIEKELSRSGISKQIIAENTMVFEALFNDIIRKGYSSENEIKIQIKRSFGNPSINMCFVGERYVPMGGDTLEDDVEYKIIKAFGDKLEYVYHASYNTIHLNVKRAHATQAVLCIAGIIGAVFVYLVLLNVLTPTQRAEILEKCGMPIEKLFTSAMLMIGTPMTFFSILKNLLETHIISKRSSYARKIQLRTLETSATMVALAVLYGFAVKTIAPFIKDVFGTYEITGYTRNDLPTLISSLMPSDIFEAFRTLSPFPLILLSILIIFALRSAENQFDRLKGFVDACYVLFSRMLNLVMFFLPAFCFLTFLNILLDKGFSNLKGVAVCWCTVILGILLVFLLYAITLKVSGIKVIDFIKRVLPILRENIKINSAIDAAPYNIRQCGKVFGINRSYLEDTMPVLAQTNLDGNCFVIMEITMLLIVSNGASIPWWNYILLASLVFFLSFGAPNQPGSILIGMLIIINYLNIDIMFPVAIYCEVLLGFVQNFVNVTGDIVMVVSEYQRTKKTS